VKRRGILIFEKRGKFSWFSKRLMNFMVSFILKGVVIQLEVQIEKRKTNLPEATARYGPSFI
jgi:hypothetical protein